MEKEIVIFQTLDAGTVAKSSVYALFSGKFKYLLIFIILTIVLNQIVLLSMDDNLELTDFTFLISLPLVITFIWFFLKKSFKKSYSKNSRHFKNISYTLDNNRFKKEGEGIVLTYKWEDLKKIKQTRDWYLIYLTGMYAFVIDKSKLEATQISELTTLFNSLKNKIKIVN